MKIVYSLIASELSENDKRLFNFNNLGGMFFTVKTVDLSLLISGKNVNNDACDLLISNLVEFEDLIKDNEYFILNFVDQFRLSRIFNVLRRFENNKYFYVSNSRVADKNCALKTISGFFYRLDKVISNPMFLLDYLYIKFFPKVKLFLFSSGNNECDISIPSFEYDVCTELSLKNSKMFASDDYHLFLDLNVAYHRDIKLTRRKSINNPKKYYDNINNFFDMLEKETWKKVKIALHPRTDHQKYDFGGREVYLNRTAELVSNADIVLGHYSTSNNYPIIFNKKLLLLVSPEFK